MLSIIQTYLKNHWRGNHSFGKSFWINLILLFSLFQIVLYFTKYLIANHPGYIQISIYPIMIFCLYLLYWFIYIWSLIGITRATAKSKNFFSSLISKGTVFCVLPLLTTLLIIQTFSYLSTGWQLLQIALKNDPITKSGFSFQIRENTLKMSGSISFELPASLKTYLSQNPQIDTVELESSGGYMIPAHQIINLIIKQKLNTHINSSCLSACSIIFLAGKKRTLSESAKLGFHQPHSISIPLFFNPAQFRKEYNFMKSRAISPKFIARALGTPGTTLWFPTRKELIVSGYITHITENL